MTEIKVPTAEEGVTTEWINSVIPLRYPGVRLEKSEIVEIIWGNAGKVRVAVEYNQAGRDLNLPARLIVKGGFQKLGPDFQFVYENEMRFYRDVLPELDSTHVPLCLFAGKDETNGESIIVMEDLSLREVIWCHATRHLSYVEAASFLKAMAGYNAKYWDSPELRTGGKFNWIWETLDGPVGQYLDAYTQPEIWQKYIVKERGVAIPRMLHDRDRIMRAYENLKVVYRNAPLCFVHGDEHQGNVFIDADGAPGFFDWQIKKAPWFQGFTYFLVAGLDIVDRRNWEKGLLAYYLDCLRANGVDAPSFENAWFAYRRDVLYGFLVWLVNDTAFQPETVCVACSTRFGAAMIDHDTLSLLA